MAKPNKFNWLISPKSFIQLIGAEYEILKRSGSVSLTKFYVSAVIILVILLISACAIFYAMELLFHLFIVELIFALFLSLLFVFIYIFLLNTFSKNIFSQKSSNDTKTWLLRIKASDLIRTGFVVFMAFLISKPIEVFFLRNMLESKVKNYRKTLLNDYNQKLVLLYDKDIMQLEGLIRFYDIQIGKFPSAALMAQKKSIQQQIDQTRKKQVKEMAAARSRTERSDFFIYRVKVASRKFTSWMICAGMIILFLIPGYLIYSISSADEYYQQKRMYEVNIVLNEYQAFGNFYREIFKNCWALDKTFYTEFDDAPFNNKLKPKVVFQTQEEFIKHFSNE